MRVGAYGSLRVATWADARPFPTRSHAPPRNVGRNLGNVAFGDEISAGGRDQRVLPSAVLAQFFVVGDILPWRRLIASDQLFAAGTTDAKERANAPARTFRPHDPPGGFSCRPRSTTA